MKEKSDIIFSVTAYNQSHLNQIKVHLILLGNMFRQRFVLVIVDKSNGGKRCEIQQYFK